MRAKKWSFARVIGLLLLGLLSLTLVVPTALADDISETQGFRKAVTVAGIRRHQQAFQTIADASGGNRLASTAGHDLSARYVYNRAATAGYNVSFQEFEFELVSDRTPPELQQVAPNAIDYTDGADFATMSYSGSGDVTAQVSTPSGSNLGCFASDWAGFPTGNIALVQRGTPADFPGGACTFRIKATNAANAGAAAVLVYNNVPGLLNGTLGPPRYDRSVMGLTQALGQQLVALVPGGLTMHVKTDTVAEIVTTRNVIAETPGGDPNHVIVVGAHLDSVSRGPGINDNGSGSATILEIAEELWARGYGMKNKVRFIWFSAEEQNLIGSTFYVNSLSQAEKDQIELMLNFDMVGSPNFVRFVYDGNNSAGGGSVGPAGSGAIEQVFLDYFASQGLATDPTPFNGRSDYGPFIAPAVGIPAGGLFTGAEGIKTAAQAATYGGTAGQPYDPCYHLACDTFNNVSLTALDQMSDATAHAVLHFARRNFDEQPLVDPTLAASAQSRAEAGRHDHSHGGETH
jgi:hypothetical protein